METSSRLIPVVDDLTHILIEAGKNKLQHDDAAIQRILHQGQCADRFIRLAQTGMLAVAFWCRAVLVQSWRSRAFSFSSSPSSIKELAEWFGLEVARIVVDECVIAWVVVLGKPTTTPAETRSP